jgi:membrane protease YdiL (CAAX protease family)
MRRCSNPWTGIIIAAIIFGAIHMNPQQIVYATLLGIIFGWIYYRTRSLLPVIVGHVLNNSVAVASMKIWGTEDIEAVTMDDKMMMVPFILLIVAALVPLVASINRKLPAVPQPWREKSED